MCFLGTKNYNSKRLWLKNGNSNKQILKFKSYECQIILHHNLQQLTNSTMTKKKEFVCGISKLRLNRNENLKLREKVLEMTRIKRERYELVN